MKHAVAILLLLVAAVVLFPLLAGSDEAPVLPEAAEEAPKVDLSATMFTVDNELVTLESKITGPTVLFYFSATCPHCVSAAPTMARLAKRHAKDGVTFIGLANQSTSTFEAEQFAKQFGWEFEVLQDALGAFRNRNAVRVTPAAFLVKPGGESELVLQPWFYGADMLLGMAVASAKGEDPWSGVEHGRYFGYQVCSDCHSMETASWAVTYHSAAYWRLNETIRARPECVRCHVTGLGQPGGFAMAEAGKVIHETAAVGCESCHGPGGPHGAANGPDGGAAWDALVKSEGLCRSCHDKGHSLVFDYAKGLELIDHRLAEDMSEEAWLQRRKDIFEGKVPRPLLEIPDGERVGDKTCAGCHKQEAKKHRKDPHGRKKGGAGCEDCHGPGSKHVESTSKDDILGLGESCPVCVLEELCRSCHEEQSFDLETWLPRVNHGKGMRKY